MQRRRTATLVLEMLPALMNGLRAEMRAAAQPELTIAQFRAVHHLAEGAKTNCELAELIGVQQPTMCRTVDSLVALGLVGREKDAVDRRKVTLALTQAGLGAYRAIQETFVGKFARVLERLPESDVVTIATGLTLLAESLQGLKEPAPRKGTGST